MGNLSNGKDVTLVNFIFNPNVNWLPIGSLDLMSTLRVHGYSIDFRDFQLYRNREIGNLKTTASFFADSADIIAVSCYSHALPYLLRILEMIKDESPSKRVILGGVGPVLAAREILGVFDCVDAIVLDDEHNVLPKLIDAFLGGSNDLSDIDNIAYLKDGDLVFRKDSNSPISYPNRSLISEMENIDLDFYHAFPVLMARGCPYKCPFCCIPAYLPQYQRRPSELVRGEIEFLSEKVPAKRFVYLLDEAFLADSDRAYDFMEFSAQDKFRDKLEFACDACISVMTEDMVHDLSKANFTRTLFGVESGSNRIIKKLNKNFTIEKAIEVVAMTRKYFDTVTASFIYGFPYETYDDFLETLFHALYLSSIKVEIHFNLLCPLPGTAIYKEFKNDLRFSRSITAQLSVKNKKQPANLNPIIDLIEKHKDIFPTFYHYASPDIARKYEVAEKYKPSIEGQHAFDYRKRCVGFEKRYVQ